MNYLHAHAYTHTHKCSAKRDMLGPDQIRLSHGGSDRAKPVWKKYQCMRVLAKFAIYPIAHGNCLHPLSITVLVCVVETQNMQDMETASFVSTVCFAHDMQASLIFRINSNPVRPNKQSEKLRPVLFMRLPKRPQEYVYPSKQVGFSD